jgi:hypothetical protein
MSKIEMSPAFVVPYAQRIAGKNTSVTVVGTPGPSFYGLLNADNNLTPIEKNATGFIYIMKGVPPTDFSTLVDNTSYENNVLIKFSSNDNDFLFTVDTANPIVYKTRYIPAMATGTATWFRWVVKNSSTNELYQQIIGDVNTIGSGADLEIPCIDVVKDVPHRIINLRLNFPTVWTY